MILALIDENLRDSNLNDSYMSDQSREHVDIDLDLTTTLYSTREK